MKIIQATKSCTKTNALKIRKKQISQHNSCEFRKINSDLKQYLDRYVKTLLVSGFNSGRYDLNLINSYLIPYLIRDKEQEASVIKKAKDFISFTFEMYYFLTK